MTKRTLMTGLALVAGSFTMTTYVEAQSQYRPGARLQPPTRNGTIAYRPGIHNVIPRAPMSKPYTITVRHSKSR